MEVTKPECFSKNSVPFVLAELSEQFGREMLKLDFALLEILVVVWMLRCAQCCCERCCQKTRENMFCTNSVFLCFRLGDFNSMQCEVE